MKRYFDIAESRMTLALDVTKEGMALTVNEISKEIHINNLREIDRKEYNKLSKEYTSKQLWTTTTYRGWENSAQQIKKYFNNRCAYCGKELPLQQDHFIALSKGGEYSKNNIVPSCQSCNGSKGAKEFETWYNMVLS